MKPIHRNTLLALSMAALTTLSLLGCSGGGGGGGPSDAPIAPSVTLTPTATKTFAFSWSDVSEESEYHLLENPDGMSGFSQVAVIPKNSTAHNLTVSLPQRVNAKYILQACNSKGCADSDEMFVTGSLAEAVGYFKASNTETEDYFSFGIALSADGRVMAVGAPEVDSGATGSNGDQADNTVDDSGAVYVFVQNDGVWSQQAYLKASNPDVRDYFGTSLSLSADGGVLAVGVYSEASSATGIDGDQTDNSATGAGAVYVFTRSGDTWAQQAYIKASNAEQDDQFGDSLALSADGSTLAVGAYGEDSNATGIDGDQAANSVASSGAVYVFTQSGDTWAQQAYIKASNVGLSDNFGSEVVLSADGNVLAVAAHLEDSAGAQPDNSATNSGAVYVFGRSGGVWSQQAYLKASNVAGSDFFGSSLALSSDGTVLAVGATGEDSAATGIDGDQTDNSATGAGAVYVFTQSANTWSQQAYLKASNTTEFDGFGTRLALSGDGTLLAVGAPNEDSGATGMNGDQTDTSASASGAVYLFKQNAGTWSQQTYVKAPITEAGDLFGNAGLALSTDSRVLAVGVYNEESNATGINGDQADNSAEDSGAVYLY